MIITLYVLIGIVLAWFVLDFVLLSWDIHRNKIIQIAFRYKPKALKFKLPKIKAKEKESFWFFMVSLLLCLGLIIAEFVMNLPEENLFNFFGLFIVFIGGLLRIWSRSTLHEFFTLQVLIQDKHKLLREGPYHFIRHPGFLSLFLILLGLGSSFSSQFGLALLLLLFIPALVYRIVKEEELMMEEFGKDYIYYMNTTKRLIPSVY
jgi:protein-S-isoprenylcysteine O-methyltransferase Ste14